MGACLTCVASTTLPATASPWRDRNMADGLLTSRSPASVMTNTPISFTAPKRFLIARTMRKLPPASPSK